MGVPKDRVGISKEASDHRLAEAVVQPESVGVDVGGRAMGVGESKVPMDEESMERKIQDVPH